LGKILLFFKIFEESLHSTAAEGRLKVPFVLEKYKQHLGNGKYNLTVR